MPKPKHDDPFMTIDTSQLKDVSGGASRVTTRSSGSNDQLTLMLTQITDSIKSLATQNQGSDPMQMMMMMMMMGGMGGGGGGGSVAAAPQAAPQAPVINITTTVKRHGY